MVSWAVANGRLVEFARIGGLVDGFPSLGGQSEHVVFHIPQTNRVLKLTIPPAFGAQGTAADYLAKAGLTTEEVSGE